MGESPYSMMNNNSIRFMDPLGDSATPNKPKLVPLIFHEKKMPNIFKNISRAIAQGKPVILTYDSNQKNKDRRRRDALRGSLRAPKGQSLDEYPFASTTQGGKGASVMAVPAREQSTQGGIMAATIAANKWFLVISF